MNLVLAGLLFFILLQLGVGLAVSRRIRNEEDYLLAGRSLGPVLVCLSVFATWFGAETCVSSAAGLYEKGLAGGAAEPFGYGLCIVFYGLAFALPLWRRRLVTLADLFRARFSPSVERLAVVLMALTSVFWASAQIRAFGQVLSASAGTDVRLAITLAAGVAILYTCLGGLRADVITDVVQGGIIILGLLLLLGIVLAQLGGVGAALQSIPSGRLTLGEPGLPRWALLETWAVPILGSVTAQELAARSLAARSGPVARNATLAGGVLYLLVGAIPAFLGLIGPTLLPEVADPEQFLPRLARAYLPTLAYVLFAGALISAILSTVDSSLLAASALLTHNLIAPLCRSADDRARVRLARWGVLVCGLGAWGLALSAETIYELVEASSSFGGAGLLVLLVLGLFTRFGGRSAGLAALVIGALTWVATDRMEAYPAPYLTSLATASIAFVVGAWISQARTSP